MSNRNIELYTDEECYQIGGNSQIIIWKPKGTIVIETPEMGFRGGIDNTTMKGFSLDKKTYELSLEFLQSGKPNKINIGIISDYDKAINWVNEVNELYNS
jgi:hypothetical protein